MTEDKSIPCAEKKSRIFPKLDDPNRDMRERIDKIFTDKFMIFVTLLMLPILLLPIFIDLSPDLLNFFNICDILIISIFIIEYGTKLYYAQDRKQFFWVGWHIIDLIIIIIALIGYLPFYESSVSSSGYLLLRLLRIFRYLKISRIAVAGVKVGNLARTEVKRNEIIQQEREIEIRIVDQDFSQVQEHIKMNHLKKIAQEKTLKWIDIPQVSQKYFAELCNDILHIPEADFRAILMEENHPQISFLEDASLVLLQSGKILYPNESCQDSKKVNQDSKEDKRDFLKIQKKRFLMIWKGQTIYSIALEDLNYFVIIHEKLIALHQKEPIIYAILFEFLSYIKEKYKTVIRDLESDLLEIENIDHADIPSDFLEHTFQIKKEISNLSSNISHFEEIISSIIAKEILNEKFTETWKVSFHNLIEDASHLHERAEECKENLLSIIELFLNRNSYETNKVMRVLAIVTAIAVVPAAVSGLLGENLLDVPFKINLWEVFVLVGSGMALILYIFYKLGWLKN